MKPSTEDRLARQILNVIPPFMHQIRMEVRAVARRTLTVPQFRILANIARGMSRVGQIANHHGVSQPAMSKMVEGLVRRGLIARAPHPGDRRRIELRLTKSGEALYRSVRRSAERKLEQIVAALDAGERRQLTNGLKQIEKIRSISTGNSGRNGKRGVP